MKKDNGDTTHVLEINLISAQGLKPPSGNLRRMQTYALAWVDPSTKLRTEIDHVGGENPTWNDRFLFRVTSEFLSRDTSGVDVEIYAVGCIRDSLIGTVRFLIGNFLDVNSKTPSFTALQIRRPSGRFHGVLNIGAMLMSCSDFSALSNISAIGYRDLMGARFRRRRRKECQRESGNCSGESRENSCVESGEHSDGDDDSSTSSSSTASTVLKDWNGFRDLAGNKGLKATPNCSLLLCGLLLQRKVHFQPSDENLHSFGGSPDRE